MRYFIKINKNLFPISKRLASAFEVDKETRIYTEGRGKKQIFVLRAPFFSKIEVMRTESLTHFYIFFLSKKYRVSNRLFVVLSIPVRDINDMIAKRSSPNNKRFIEVCSGAGGFSAGFIANNFEPLLLNDNNKQCFETLRLNYPNTHIHFGKMEDINLEEYRQEELDVLIGGLPCQSFSQIGNRKGIDDPRGRLVFHFIQMIDKLKPKVFIIENVPGLISVNKGEVLKLIIKNIKGLKSYRLYTEVLNANNYNVAQNRKRLFIVGVKSTIDKIFQFPKHHVPRPVLKDVLYNCPPSNGYVYTKKVHELFKMIPEGGC